jgi:hypothetical protein
MLASPAHAWTTAYANPSAQATDAEARVAAAAAASSHWASKSPAEQAKSVRQALAGGGRLPNVDLSSMINSVIKLTAGGAQETLCRKNKLEAFVKSKGADPRVELMSLKRGRTGMRSQIVNAIAILHNRSWIVRCVRPLCALGDLTRA